MMEKRPTVGVKYIQLKEQYVENAKMRVFDAGKYKVAEVKWSPHFEVLYDIQQASNHFIAVYHHLQS